MFKVTSVYPSIAVKDIDKAKKFYEGKLGLKPETGADPGGVFYKFGGGKFFVYTSSFAGTNKATYMNCDVDDIEQAVEDLKSKGVAFEHYDMPKVKREGDVHIFDDLKAAWFKDPDGNIIAMSEN